MFSPALTVLIPTRNRGKLLRETIESVRRQTFTDFELRVFDNASTDDTAEICQSFGDSRLKHIRRSIDLGLKANWVQALRSTRSQFVCLTSDDDLYHPTYLESAIRALRNNPSAAYYACASGHFISDPSRITLRQFPDWLGPTDAPLSVRDCRENYAPWLRGMPICFNALCLRTSMLDRVRLWGGEGWPLSIDYLIAGQVAAQAPGIYDSAVRTYYRVHAGQTTGTTWRGKRRALEHWYVLQALLEEGLNSGFLKDEHVIRQSADWDPIEAANLAVAAGGSSNLQAKRICREMVRRNRNVLTGFGVKHKPMLALAGASYVQQLYRMYGWVLNWPPSPPAH